MATFQSLKPHALTLFQTQEHSKLTTTFDRRGFFLSGDAQVAYNQIKNLPHIYIVWYEREKGIYIGKSFQQNGRMQRGHYYHLGTLGHELLGTKKEKEQNHRHWVETWFDIATFTHGAPYHSVTLYSPVYVSFVYGAELQKLVDDLPLGIVANLSYKRKVKEVEGHLIRRWRDQGVSLLNRQ